MKSWVETAIGSVLAICAVGIAASLVHREFFDNGAAASAAAPDPAKPTVEKDWRELLIAGHTLGSTAAPVQIIEFADLECPYCRRFSLSLDSVTRTRPGDIAITFVHYPIRAHRFARPAARAAECADAQHMFGPFISLIYLKQDSLGLKSWSSFAREAGVADTGAFGRCNSMATPVPMVESGSALGKKLGVRGTPTVIVNGLRFDGVPPEDVLSPMIDSIVKAAKRGT